MASFHFPCIFPSPMPALFSAEKNPQGVRVPLTGKGSDQPPNPFESRQEGFTLVSPHTETDKAKLYREG